jgi:Cd2+/Zn2+-exporting ATPase
LILTMAMFLVWWLGFGIAPFESTPESFSALYRSMTLLVVVSPCALVLSIPSAILAAIAWGAKHGVLFRGGAAVEKLAQVDTVALDKTGTLTTGNLRVREMESFPPGNQDRLLGIACSLEANSTHPIARAILAHGDEHGVPRVEVTNFQSLTGMGLRGVIPEGEVFLGRRDLLKDGPLKELVSGAEALGLGYSEVWIIAPDAAGRFILKDEVRESSAAVLETLKKSNIRSLMLTGDRPEAALDVAQQLSLDEQDVYAGLFPEDKVAIIQRLRDEGRKVAMVGDGVNDAPSLATAFVSVAMGGRGSDAALEQSEVVLMNDRIEGFLDAIRLSRKARRIIRQNLVISLGTVILMLFLALGGNLPLTLGVFAHEGSTVLVVLNSLRLLFGKG